MGGYIATQRRTFANLRGLARQLMGRRLDFLVGSLAKADDEDVL